MKIAASSCCWWHSSLEEALRKAHEAGFTTFEALTFPAAEICPLHGDLRQLTVKDLSALFRKYEMTLVALHLGAIWTSTEALRRAMTDYAKRAVEVAQEMGCGIVVEGGPDRAKDPIEPFMDSLAELAPVFERTNVKLALENHYGNWIQFIQDYEWIFQRIDSPSVGITLDTGHFTAAGVDPEAVARRFPKRIFHVHIKDHIGRQSVALGTGQTNNFGMARALKEAGYTGYLSQELEVADHSQEDIVAAQGIHYLRRLVAV